MVTIEIKFILNSCKFFIPVDVSPNVSLLAKTSLEQLEYPYQPSAVKAIVDFVICAQLPKETFLNAQPIAQLERLLVWILARRARLFASAV